MEKELDKYLNETKTRYRICFNADYKQYYNFVYTQVSLLTLIADFNRFICESEEYLTGQGRKYATTARRTNKKYKEQITLNHVENGSIILDITANLLSGIILKFLERLSEQGKYCPQNSIKIYIDNVEKIKINANEVTIYNGVNKENRHNNELGAEYLLDKALEGVGGANTIEDETKKLLTNLKQMGVTDVNVSYDSKGCRTLIGDTERIFDEFG